MFLLKINNKNDCGLIICILPQKPETTKSHENYSIVILAFVGFCAIPLASLWQPMAYVF